jgi:quinol monooxygenase YgiN
MIGLVVHFKVKADKGAEFEDIFRRMADGVRTKEPGNLLYKLGKSRTDANTYVAMEIYADQAAIDAHMNTPHLTAHLDAFRDCLAPEPPQAEFIDLIADGS